MLNSRRYLRQEFLQENKDIALTILLPSGALVANPILEGLGLQAFPPDSQWRLYRDLAWLWPIISPPADHIRENEEFSKMIQAQCPGRVRTLLHLGCGGGHDDFTLKSHFEVTGVDVSAAMLGLARRLNPEVDYHLGDMRTGRLEKTFDSVIIGDSISYMLTREDLFAAFRTAFVHLKPGGMLNIAEVVVDIEGNAENPERLKHILERWGYAALLALQHGGSENVVVELDAIKNIYLRNGEYLIPAHKWQEMMEEAGFRNVQVAPINPQLGHYVFRGESV